MRLPSHRLDLLVVPQPGEEGDVARLGALLGELRDRGVVDGGAPGPEAGWLVEGGFRFVRVDDPGQVTLYANQQGGFRVACPACSANLVPLFGAARRDGHLTCPRCGVRSQVRELAFAPPAAFGRAALLVADAESSDLTPASRALCEERLGPLRVIGRRVAP